MLTARGTRVALEGEASGKLPDTMAILPGATVDDAGFAPFTPPPGLIEGIEGIPEDAVKFAVTLAAFAITTSIDDAAVLTAAPPTNAAPPEADQFKNEDPVPGCAVSAISSPASSWRVTGDPVRTVAEPTLAR
jgi:hypothetical protein